MVGPSNIKLGNKVLLPVLVIGFVLLFSSFHGSAFAHTPLDQFYAAQEGDDLLTLSKVSGNTLTSKELTPEPPGMGFAGLAFDARQPENLYASQGSSTPNIYKINSVTKTVTKIGSTGIGTSVQGLNAGPNCNMYGVVNKIGIDLTGADTLITVNLITGAGTLVGSIKDSVSHAQLDGFQDLVFDSTGQLYGVQLSFQNLKFISTLYKINSNTGVATKVADIKDTSGKSTKVMGLEIDQTDQMYGGTLGGKLIKIDKSNGKFTIVGPTGPEDEREPLLALAFLPADNFPPTVTINPTTPFYVLKGTTYSDPGATASSCHDASLIVSKNIAPPFDITTPAVYTETYSATSLNGKTSSATRTVDVVDIFFESGVGTVTYTLDTGDTALITIVDLLASGSGTINAVVHTTSDATGGIPITLTEGPLGTFTNQQVSFVSTATNTGLFQLHAVLGDKITAVYHGLQNSQEVGIAGASQGLSPGAPPPTTDALRFDSDAFYPTDNTALTGTAGTGLAITATITDTPLVGSPRSFSGLTMTETPAGSGKYLLNVGLSFSNIAGIAENMANGASPKVLKVVTGDVITATATGITMTATTKILSPPAELTINAGAQPTYGQNVDCVALGLADIDGDGICDSWETAGGLVISGVNPVTYTYPCSPLLDDPANPVANSPAGTNPTVCPDTAHKDVYVEVDYMTNHHPDDLALLDVINAYKNKNINLHIQVNEDIGFHAASMPYFTPPSPPNTHDFQQQKKIHFGTAAERALGANTLTDKSLVFHYALFLHGLNDAPGSSGYGEIGGNDFAVTMGSFAGSVGSHDQQAAAFMHELGHNLGLRHGGNEDLNCKPNYPSVMNYAYMFPGSSGGFINGRTLDYSQTKYSLINEASLPEGTTKSITGTPVRSTVVGYWDGAASKTPQVVSTNTVIDWNQNLPTVDTGYGLDVHYISTILDCQDKTKRTLYSYNDWANLAFNFRPSGNYANGLSTVPHFDTGGDPSVGTPDAFTIAPLLDVGHDNSTNEGVFTTERFNVTSYDNPWKLTVNYGDGSPTETINGVAGGLTNVLATHTWTQEGIFTITVTVQAVDNTNTPIGNINTGTIQMTVNEFTPTVTVPSSAPINEGDSYAGGGGTITDPSADTFTVAVDYGDDTTMPIIPDTARTFTVPSHVYAEEGTYTVKVTATEADGHGNIDTTGTTLIVVNPVVDTTVDAADQIVQEGHLLGLRGPSFEESYVALFTDPGTPDTHTATIDWGDGSPVDNSNDLSPVVFVTEPTGEISGAVYASHTYVNEPTTCVECNYFTAKVTVTDNNGDTKYSTFKVHVNEVTPVVTVPSSDPIDAGGSYDGGISTITDPSADTFTATVDYGDDSSPVLLTPVTARTFTVPSHPYAEAGTYTVTVTATEADGHTAIDTTGTTMVTVNPVVVNSVPIVTFPVDCAVSPPLGDVGVCAAWTDADTSDTHTYTIDWGDGSEATTGVTSGAGEGTVTGAHDYSSVCPTGGCEYTLKVTVTDNHLGSGFATKIIDIIG